MRIMSNNAFFSLENIDLQIFLYFGLFRAENQVHQNGLELKSYDISQPS